MKVPLAVTTSGEPDGPTLARAKTAARDLGIPFIPRGRNKALSSMISVSADAFVVFMRDGVELWDQEGHFRWSPGMALLRMKTMEAGGGDTLVKMADLQPGESILDCTLGLAQDALVAARAVGPSGRVVGLEKSLALFAVVSEGLRDFDPGSMSCRIEPVHADAEQWLKTCTDRSFDRVLFDPMFGQPRKSQPSFESLRRHADYAPLTAGMLEEARRVARKAVVVKGAKYSPDLKKLGLMALPHTRYADVDWARIDLDVRP